MTTGLANTIPQPDAGQTTSPELPFPAGSRTSLRLRREWKTLVAMVQCYCRGQHGTGAELCHECRELLGYAALRLDRCRFGEHKPTCAKCPVHCYQRDRRDQVKRVMRYAGPKMVWQHPILSLFHWWDSLHRRVSVNA